MKSRRFKIVPNERMLKFAEWVSYKAVDIHIIFQSNWKTPYTNPVDSKLACHPRWYAYIYMLDMPVLIMILSVYCCYLFTRLLEVFCLRTDIYLTLKSDLSSSTAVMSIEHSQPEMFAIIIVILNVWIKQQLAFCSLVHSGKKWFQQQMFNELNLCRVNLSYLCWF